MEHIYAEALWQMIEGGMKPKEAVAKLRETLQRRGRMSLLPKIGRAFARVGAKNERESKVILAVARGKDATAVKRQAKEALRELGVDADELEVRIDDTLIGGWRLEGRERLVDASYKKSLLSIYNRATQ